jgi:hypothetical protein
MGAVRGPRANLHEEMTFMFCKYFDSTGSAVLIHAMSLKNAVLTLSMR